MKCDCGNDEFVPVSMTDYPVMKCTNCDYSYQDYDITFEVYAEHFKPVRPKDWKVELVNGKWIDTRPEQLPEEV